MGRFEDCLLALKGKNRDLDAVARWFNTHRNLPRHPRMKLVGGNFVGFEMIQMIDVKGCEFLEVLEFYCTVIKVLVRKAFARR